MHPSICIHTIAPSRCSWASLRACLRACLSVWLSARHPQSATERNHSFAITIDLHPPLPSFASAYQLRTLYLLLLHYCVPLLLPETSQDHQAVLDAPCCLCCPLHRSLTRLCLYSTCSTLSVTVSPVAVNQHRLNCRHVACLQPARLWVMNG